MRAMNLQRVGRWLKSAKAYSRSPKNAPDGRLLVVRQLEKLVEQAELGHDFQRRGVNGVAAEIAQEVGMLLKHDNVDAGARQQEAEHPPAGSAADDAATRGDSFGGHWRSSGRVE
jgi:hypothetical protein